MEGAGSVNEFISAVSVAANIEATDKKTKYSRDEEDPLQYSWYLSTRTTASRNRLQHGKMSTSTARKIQLPLLAAPGRNVARIACCKRLQSRDVM